MNKNEFYSLTKEEKDNFIEKNQFKILDNLFKKLHRIMDNQTLIFYDFEAISVSRDVDIISKIENCNDNISFTEFDFDIVVSDAYEKDLYYIYFLVSKLDKKVFYVGKGKQRRCFIHEWGAKNNQDFKNPHKYRKLKQLLKKDGYFIVIPFVSKLEVEVLQKEVEYIKYFGRETLCNLTDGGENNPMSSLEARKKVREFHTGRKRSKGTCEKISKARKGKSLSKAHAEKIKKTLLGNKRAGKKIKVILENGIEILFNSINEMKSDSRITAHTVTIGKKLKENKEVIIKNIKYKKYE